MNLEELAVRIRRGDREALRELIEAYGAGIYQKAYNRTKDQTLAREATRRTFAQFVSTLQNRPEADGWRLWLDALSGRNIEEFSSIPGKMQAIAAELEGELFGNEGAPVPNAAENRLPEAKNRLAERSGQAPAAAPEPRKRETPPDPEDPVPYGEASRQREVSQRSKHQTKPRPADALPVRHKKTRHKADFADEAPRGGSQRWAIAGLILLSAALFWVALGVAMSIGIVPKADLGYAWFNEHVYRFF